MVYYHLKLECEYPSSTLSIGLALAATLALEIARGIITITTGGYCSCFRTIANLPEIARICYVISWYVVVVHKGASKQTIFFLSVTVDFF